MLTYHDTSELDISNQMKGLWELQDTKVGVFLQNMGSKITNLNYKRKEMNQYGLINRLSTPCRHSAVILCRGLANIVFFWFLKDRKCCCTM